MPITLQNIHKTFGQPGSSSERRVLSDLSMNIADGDTIAITGPSGSGKTTLLNLLAALDVPDSGTIEFNGTDLTVLRGQDLDLFRNRSIGLVFQLHHLLPQCTLLENVLVPALAGNRRVPPAIVARGEMLIRRMGLWEARNQKPGSLSGGECQRTAVARALINDPKVLLADEPTGALDQQNAQNLIDLLLEVNRVDTKTLVLVTHSPDIARRMNTHYSLRDGKLVHEE